ncbi:MAG: hypothetical protein ISS69_17420 [Phycisphaerae bacterium]|nr:hypothetical protein [Planctomycetota bacterium]MBL7221892.1 hypothetical protein [Phycisphaerae bacterium]
MAPLSERNTSIPMDKAPAAHGSPRSGTTPPRLKANAAKDIQYESLELNQTGGCFWCVVGGSICISIEYSL